MFKRVLLSAKLVN